MSTEREYLGLLIATYSALIGVAVWLVHMLRSTMRRGGHGKRHA